MVNAAWNAESEIEVVAEFFQLLSLPLYFKLDKPKRIERICLR